MIELTVPVSAYKDCFCDLHSRAQQSFWTITGIVMIIKRAAKLDE